MKTMAPGARRLPAAWPARLGATGGAGKPVVMVVDDEPAHIKTLYQALCAEHQVLMATSGEQALKLVERQRPELLLLDASMPGGMDGHELCRRLKSDPLTRDIPVIFVSAQADAEAETLALELGAVDFIAKPINPKIVRARVQTHLTLQRQNELLRQWSSIDGLTGVCNRGHFDLRLATEIGRAARNGDPLSLLLIGVDGLREANEALGWQAGDDILCRIAQSLQRSLRRPADLVARYSPTEFVCLLPETDLGGALTVARTLGPAVSQAVTLPLDAEAPATGTTPEVPAPPALRVSVSVGAACWVRGAEGGAQALLAEAARRLQAVRATQAGHFEPARHGSAASAAGAPVALQA